MSGPADPDLAKHLLNEVGARRTFSELKSDAASLLYLVQSILNGTCCDFGFDSRSHRDIEHRYTAFRAELRQLDCFPLLCPYFDQRKWSELKLKELHASYQVAKELTR